MKEPWSSHNLKGKAEMLGSLDIARYRRHVNSFHQCVCFHSICLGMHGLQVESTSTCTEGVLWMPPVFLSCTASGL